MKDEWRKAAIAGNSEVIGRLLADGAYINIKDRYGQTALMLAALHGRDAVLRVLLDHGADMNVTAKYGLSALMLAIINHHDVSAKHLVDAGADLSITGTGAPGFAGKTARCLARHGGLDSLAAYIAKVEHSP